MGPRLRQFHKYFHPILPHCIYTPTALGDSLVHPPKDQRVPSRHLVQELHTLSFTSYTSKTRHNSYPHDCYRPCFCRLGSHLGSFKLSYLTTTYRRRDIFEQPASSSVLQHEKLLITTGISDRYRAYFMSFATCGIADRWMTFRRTKGAWHTRRNQWCTFGGLSEGRSSSLRAFTLLVASPSFFENECLVRGFTSRRSNKLSS